MHTTTPAYFSNQLTIQRLAILCGNCGIFDRLSLGRGIRGFTIRKLAVLLRPTIDQYSFNERHVKTQANTCMTYN